ncbi:transposase family Tnp2 protein, partial [Rhizoctonia solani 123E]
MSEQDLEKCFCCGEWLRPRQLYRHVENYQKLLALRISQVNLESNEEDHARVVGGNDNIIGSNEAIDLELMQAPADNDASMDELNPEISFGPAPDLLEPALGLRRNPPVTIEDWPEPDLDLEYSDEEDDGNPPIDGSEGDPEFVERQDPLRLDPDDEPEYGDEEMQDMLREVLGDIADEQWVDMYARNMSDEDFITLQFLATRLRTHFSRQTYEDLRQGAFEELGIPSEFIAWRRLRILSGLESRLYDCCINSCCCYLGRYQGLDKCPFCNENRYKTDGTARRSFRYTPLIPQLQAFFQNPRTANNVRHRYRAEQQSDPNVVEDVISGSHYRSLRQTQLDPNSQYRIFDHPNDIALGLSTDGFTLFKRRRRGHSTAWPIILVNYNLHPKIRTRLENVLCVGVIPGPTQCKDLNSFLIPLLDELLQLEAGIPSSALKPDYDATPEDEDQVAAAQAREHEAMAAGEGECDGYNFVLRAFLIIVFGDIPAISKLMCMKGHNALTPCRACYIQGVLCRLRKNAVYYVPLQHPDELRPTNALYMRTQELFLNHLAELDAARTQVRYDQVAKDYGINGRSVFTHLKSIDLSSSFPYDIMHLLFENLVPNMIRHWTGQFKGLDQGNGSYQLPKPRWEGVGRSTKLATKFLPSSFVGTLPDIAQDFLLYKAEALAFWIQYLAPVLLLGVLPNKYYKHLLLMREIVLRCLQLEITHDEINELEQMVYQWVFEYEKYYYQYRSSRLPTCPLTIHALLHMPYYIRKTGPLWASWAFVMERFCGHLLPAVKNRIRPYEHLDNYVQRRAQMQAVSKIYDFPSLARPFVHYTYVNGERISSHEVIYPAFPDFVLGTPINRHPILDTPLLNKLAKYFTLFRPGLRGNHLLDRITRGKLISHGRIRLVGGGDNIRIADLIIRDPAARDNSFIKV